VDLYEYQAKDLFAAHGVPVLPGSVATTPDEVADAAAELGGTVVVKAQVKTGGRGKAGGVRLAEGPDAARRCGQALLGKKLGETAVVKIPRGTFRYEITEIGVPE